MKVSKTQLKAIERNFVASLPKSMPKAQRAATIKAFYRGMTHGWGQAGLAVTPPRGARYPAAFTGGGSSAANPLGGSPQVLGKDWLSVVATPPSPAVTALLAQAAGGPAHPATNGAGVQTAWSGSSSTGSSAYSSTLTVTSVPPAAGPDLAVLRALLHATTAVSGSWGHGRLLRASLLSVLITSNGRVLFGAVTPAVLYADAASLSR
jgi:hypothetical protein